MENSTPAKTCLRAQCYRRAWKPRREGTEEDALARWPPSRRGVPGARRRARLPTPNSSSCFICLDVSNFLYLPKVYKTLSPTKSLFPVPLLLEVSCHFLSDPLLGSRMDGGWSLVSQAHAVLTPAKPHESLTSRHYGLLLTDLGTAPWGIRFLEPTHWSLESVNIFYRHMVLLWM